MEFSRHGRGLALSFLCALGSYTLIALASQLNLGDTTLTESIQTFFVFFAVAGVIGAVVASVVTAGLSLVVAARGGSPLLAFGAALIGTAVIGVVFALVTEQIPHYDVTLLLIMGCCTGALAGPASFVVSPPERI